MEIEFDPAKDAANLKTHKVSLRVGKAVLEDPRRIDEVDDRFDYGEERTITLGMVKGMVFVAVWTQRGGVFRMISVRKAEKHECDRYYQEQA
jgi:uncharacterized protein